MRQYLDLLRDVRDRGDRKESRAVLKDGSRPRTRSLFGAQYRINLDDGFPLLTTKRLPFAHIVTELL